MKYLIKIIITSAVLFVLLSSCGNDGGKSPVIKRMNVDFRDFNVYCGSSQGAKEVSFDDLFEVETSKLNQDSLCRLLTIRFLGNSVYQDINSTNKNNLITFEFMGDDGNMLTYTDGSIKIVSSYIYKGDSLFVMKNGDDPVYVATKEADNDQFSRRLVTCGYISDVIETNEEGEEVTTSKLKTMTENGETYDLAKALKYAGYPSSESFTTSSDTLVWCNVKYIYN